MDSIVIYFFRNRNESVNQVEFRKVEDCIQIIQNNESGVNHYQLSNNIAFRVEENQKIKLSNDYLSSEDAILDEVLPDEIGAEGCFFNAIIDSLVQDGMVDWLPDGYILFGNMELNVFETKEMMDKYTEYEACMEDNDYDLENHPDFIYDNGFPDIDRITYNFPSIGSGYFGYVVEDSIGTHFGIIREKKTKKFIVSQDIPKICAPDI